MLKTVSSYGSEDEQGINITKSRCFSPVIDGVSISENVVIKKRGMSAYQTLRIDCSTHVINVCLSRTIEPREIALAKFVERTSKLIFRECFQECLVSHGGVVIDGFK
jgi:hypothetical protein